MSNLFNYCIQSYTDGSPIISTKELYDDKKKKLINKRLKSHTRIHLCQHGASAIDTTG